MSAFQNGGSSRFDDSPLAFGLTRFTDGGERVLWRFYVSRFCGQHELIGMDASIETLTKMRAWLDRSIEMVSSDGGRKSDAA
jgi:hypothetical protein